MAPTAASGRRQWWPTRPCAALGRPEEVAALAVMLASDEAAYMTGAELTIDGGILAGSAAAPGR
ncbi:SDR family oxidoreductase [Paracoccus sp. NBH48]|uniref:SDR family oxidoreductase n=1 Tax=Paracoccus sp. NBH48 TaxID=2596918 RepID=UPI0021021534|nr:SDR family oxidoreductase [Paracoccus sp. NBH48]